MQSLERQGLHTKKPGWRGLFAIFLELWRLEPREQVLVLRQLRGRGKRRARASVRAWLV